MTRKSCYHFLIITLIVQVSLRSSSSVYAQEADCGPAKPGKLLLASLRDPLNPLYPIYFQLFDSVTILGEDDHECHKLTWWSDSATTVLFSGNSNSCDTVDFSFVILHDTIVRTLENHCLRHWIGHRHLNSDTGASGESMFGGRRSSGGGHVEYQKFLPPDFLQGALSSKTLNFGVAKPRPDSEFVFTPIYFVLQKRFLESVNDLLQRIGIAAGAWMDWGDYGEGSLLFFPPLGYMTDSHLCRDPDCGKPFGEQEIQRMISFYVFMENDPDGIKVFVKPYVVRRPRFQPKAWQYESNALDIARPACIKLLDTITQLSESLRPKR